MDVLRSRCHMIRLYKLSTTSFCRLSINKPFSCVTGYQHSSVCRSGPVSRTACLPLSLAYNGSLLTRTLFTNAAGTYSQLLHINRGQRNFEELKATVPYRVASRSFSADGRDNSGSEPPSELKGYVVHLPNPVQWLKNKIYVFSIRNLLDPSFNLDEFIVGSKQALAFLTRLIVLKDFETLKTVATPEAVETVTKLIAPWTEEQNQSIEMLVEDINLTAASICSMQRGVGQATGKVGWKVEVEVLCIAMKRFKTRPLLLQLTVRFARVYEPGQVENSDWMIADIREFVVREMTSAKSSDQQVK